MHADHEAYLRYGTRSALAKDIQSLLGLVEGVAIDGRITPDETAFLQYWLDSHEFVKNRHPFNELVPVVARALDDGVLDDEERLDIEWLCRRLISDKELERRALADMQRLHGVLGGIIADRVVTADELRGLRDWLEDHESLKTLWPYDEVDSLVTAVMRDGKVTADESEMLVRFFNDFVQIGDDKVVSELPLDDGLSITGVCAVCPDIEFDDRSFCLTGASSLYPRVKFVEVIESVGGRESKSVTKKTNYLVIGAEGNPCWAYSCYGRKVEAAMRLRRQGSQISIVHETDVHDALLDAGCA